MNYGWGDNSTSGWYLDGDFAPDYTKYSFTSNLGMTYNIRP
jgi:hypothetical protein